MTARVIIGASDAAAEGIAEAIVKFLAQEED